MSDLSRAIAQKEGRRKMVAMSGDGRKELDKKYANEIMKKVLAEEAKAKEAIVAPARKIKMELRAKAAPKKTRNVTL